jgi:hypothetical protein
VPGPGATTSQPPVQSVSPNDWFQEANAETGIDFKLAHKKTGPFITLSIVGGGVAICDFDGDGHADVLLVAPEDIASGSCCKLFHNKGQGKFEEVSSTSGIDAKGMVMGCAVGDIDNDGMPDLLITGYGTNKLYKNLGGMKFKDITAGSGLEALSPTSWASSAAFADIDNDGKLDVYIGRYVIYNKTTIQLCDYNGVKGSCGPLFYDPQRGNLYQNVGGGRFKDVTEKMGFDDVHGKVLGVAWADINDDLIPDCYLANDEVNGDLLLSRKGHKFTNIALTSGVALAADGKPQGGMGVDWGDYNRDGRFDLFVTTYQFEPNSLYSASPTGLYQWQSLATGLDQPSRLMVGFGTKFLDVNNDGWLDIAIANGHVRDNQEQIDKQTTYKQPMQLFISDANATAYLDKSREAGPGFTRPGVGRGLAVGDLDDDGREDIILMDEEGGVRVLMNRTPITGNWLRVALHGTKTNRMGLGSKVIVRAGKEKWIGNCTTGGSYLSSSDSRLHFGLGKVDKIDSVEVHWPSGKTSLVKSVPVSKDLVVEEPK